MVVVGLIHHAPTPPYTSRQILEAAKDLGADTVYLRPIDLSIHVEETGEVRVLKRGRPLRLDALFVRGLLKPSSIEEAALSMDIVIVFEENGVLTINNSRGILTARDKLLSTIILRKKGIPVLPSVVSMSMAPLLRSLEEWGRGVIKPIIGSLGRGVIPVDNPDIAYSVIRQLFSWSQPVLLQKHVDKPGNRDLRVLVVNGEVVASYYRVAPHGGFKTNVSQGARVEGASDVDRDVLEAAIKSVDTLGLLYGGVDIIIARDGYYVLEVNSMPNWKGALEIGVNPAPILVRSVLELVKR